MEGKSAEAAAPRSASFFSRHQFLIYRLFSLCGLVPVGAYMVVHLVTNVTILNGVPAFQAAVNRIHSLGSFLPFVEWTFIFLPLLFHAGIGWLIVSGAVPNTSSYAYSGNVRYTLQRATGIVAFFYILFHVLQLNHIGFGQFNPEHASSSTAVALDKLWVKVVYAIGVLACVYHLSNGLWTFGITWGIWTSRAAQRRANYVALAFGLALATVGLSALTLMSRVDVPEARETEDRLETAKQLLEGQPIPLQSSAVSGQMPHEGAPHGQAPHGQAPHGQAPHDQPGLATHKDSPAK